MSPITVLLVEDDRVYATGVKRALADSGIALVIISSVLKGIAYLGHNHVDFVLADYRLDVYDGEDVISMSQELGIPCAMVTNFDLSGIKKQLKNPDSFSVWKKNDDLKKLPDRIRNEISCHSRAV